MRFLLVLAAFACLLAGCGGDDSSGDEAPPAARAQDFPKADSQRLQDLLANAGSGPVLAPSSQEFRTGRNRFGFALFNADRSQIADASVAIYVASADGGPARGPYLARYESLDVRPQFQSRQTSADPDAAKSIYTAEIPFDEPGRYQVVGVARRGGELVAATPATPGFRVTNPARDPIPAVGEPPPRIHTPTEDDAAGDIASIDTRLPPSSMHEADFADVLGKKPVVLLFATPQLCQSRVCGPVTDVALQLKASYGDRVEFIHQEVYAKNDPNAGLRPPLEAFHLRTEPWLFVIDAQGKITARLEGSFGIRAFENAL